MANDRLVFLVNPGEPFLEHRGDRAPLGLGYISSYLKKAGLNTRIYDLNHDKVESLLEDASEERPGHICIGIATPCYNTALNLNKLLRNYGYGGRIVAGGHHVTAIPNEFDTIRNYDYILRGDGEEGMLRIVNEVPYEQIIRSKDIEPLDQIPWPDRESMKMERYDMKLGGKKGGTMVTSRGCLYDCNYCGSSTIKKLREHSAEYSVGEMKHLMEQYNIEGIYIGDDIFTFNKKRVNEICKLIKTKLPTKPTLRATTRVDLVDRKLLEEMYSAGFDILSFGLESGDDNVLKGFNKGTDTARARRTVKDCKDVGIKVKGFWIMGLPTETKESLQKTIDFAKELNCEYNDVYPLVPYPSAQLWKNSKGIEIQYPEGSNWEEYYQVGKDGKFKLKIKHPNLSESDILEHVDKFRKEVGSKGLTYD